MATPLQHARSSPLVVAVAVVLSLAVTVGSVPVGATALASLAVTGPGVVDGGDSPAVASWQSATVTVSLADADEPRDLCLHLNTSERQRPLGCRSLADTAGGTATVSVEQWPVNQSGTVTLVAVTAGANGTLDRTERPLLVLAPGDDYDDDGRPNRAERTGETDPMLADTDGDGLEDGPEVDAYGTDPTARDTDGDDLADDLEVREYGTDPTARDTDGDGLPDGDEVTMYETDPTRADTDGDGLEDGTEVDRTGTDPARADTDGDGLEDGPEVNAYETDPTRADTDGDGVDDGAEVNQHGTDPTRADTDGDGFDDGAEVHQYGTDPTRANTAPEEGGGWLILPVVPVQGPVGPLLLGTVLSGVVAVLTVVAVRAWRERAARDTADADPHRPGRTRSDAPHSDAERVRRLLDANDGRLPQSEIVARTDWSKSKVSRVLSSMAEDGDVRKIRVGRENLVARPGDEPEHAKRVFGE
jgi:hypothetical protein